MTEIEMAGEWLRQAAKAVGEGRASLLLQGYPYTCFARIIESGSLELPPPFRECPPNWDLFWDVRVFGPKGEWHAWRDGAGRWWDRRYEAKESENEIHRRYVLWGTAVEVTSDVWSCCYEERGAEVWVPFEATGHRLPLRLKLKLLIDYEPETGMAGVVDAVMCDFDSKEIP